MAERNITYKVRPRIYKTMTGHIFARIHIKGNLASHNLPYFNFFLPAFDMMIESSAYWHTFNSVKGRQKKVKYLIKTPT